ncbi:MAG: alanine--tRNA ligase [Clostridiales bacterium]|nr:alanine--tRNA ligase [Clostridiales bacterium]
MLTSKEIREKFIRYFEAAGHTHVASGSLVPHNDPTLLFTNAGMNQFKEVFLGVDQRPYTRAVTSQKCVRAGGKHNDLETVGKTARHHTFFEMLGNFSFGDYFKKDAINFAWTFLTEELGLNPDDLWITIYRDDDEAYDLWHERTGFGPEKILRLGEKDNFWQMGDVGPCGPCSEIHYDRGSALACDHEDGCALGVCDCDRWLEIWNLVFMQYNRHEDGTLEPLPKPSVDTGMGLERIASVLQGVPNNWETDLFKPLLTFIEGLCGKSYDSGKAGFPFRVIADHGRCATFLIADGVLPSNEGRGYVLRRIIRRAVRLGKTLGLNEPFLYKITAEVGRLMGDAYPSVVEQASFVEETIRSEEERFMKTLSEGMERVNETVRTLQSEGKTEIDGKTAFTFYDTYGFPIDLTKDVAEENGLTVDAEGFERAMDAQRQQSKAAQQTVDAWDLAKDVRKAFPDLAKTVFTGYDHLTGDGKILGLLKDGEGVHSVTEGRVQVILDQTPFYAQGGGQIGDRGELTAPKGRIIIDETVKLPDGTFVLTGSVTGTVTVGDPVTEKVYAGTRRNIARNHTATHLLHAALRQVLGEGVHQAGSLVADDHLRFDFSLQRAMTPSEIREVEALVNREIEQGEVLSVREMSIDEANDNGYMALFGEKYGDVVRGVQIGDISRELCGGTHVKDISEIGIFKIISEGAVSAGIRRITALTGAGAYRYLTEQMDTLDQLKTFLKVNRPEDILGRVENLEATLKNTEKELAQLKQEKVKESLGDRLKNIVKIDDFDVVVDKVKAGSPDELRQMADQYRDKIKSGLVLLASETEDNKVMLVSMLTKDEAVKRLHAGKIIGQVAEMLGGRGGGRPDMAQAGGKDPEKLSEALNKVADIVRNQLKER